MSKTVDWLKNYWLELAQGAAWLLSLFSTFVYPPPANSLDLTLGTTNTGFNAARFVVTLLLAVAFFVTRRRVKKASAWLIFSAAALIATGALFFDYQARLERWTATYNGGLVVRGDELTPHARQYASQEHIELNRSGHSHLILAYAGDAAKVWANPEQLSERWRELVLRYTAIVCLLTLCVVAVLQTTRQLKPRTAA